MPVFGVQGDVSVIFNAGILTTAALTTRSTAVSVRLNSHLRLFRRELLRELFRPRNRKKWVHNPLLNFSVCAIVDQIAGVNAPI